MLLPSIVIITTVSVGFTAQRAALLGIACAFAVSLVRKDTRPSLKDVLDIFEKGARVALPVIAAVASAGIIAGVVGMTGLGAKFAAGIISLADGVYCTWDGFAHDSKIRRNSYDCSTGAY